MKICAGNSILGSSGTEQDNFYMETFSTPGGEKWCITGKPLDPEMSADGFGLLEGQSILYSQKNGAKYKLKPFLVSDMEKSVRVNHFYCEPYTKTVATAA